MYATNELMFPAYVIPELADSRGQEWHDLITRLSALPETDVEVLAFMLMMIRLNGCMECETDSYRAMRGCSACALQTLRRYKGPDRDLLNAYHNALQDMKNYLERTGRTRFQTMMEIR